MTSLFQSYKLLIKEINKFLKKNGYRAPKDYGLMTYDRLMYRFWNEDAIAAVDNHVDQIGMSVANAVIDLIEEKEITMMFGAVLPAAFSV